MEKKRILIIEDNPTFSKMLKMRLESNGYQVLIAADGLVGLDVFRREKPDLLITDLMLPGLDGHKICRMIKFDKTLATIPVIMLTARDLKKDETLAIKCGADIFLGKTTPASVVLSCIRQLMNRNNDEEPVHENQEITAEK